MTIVRFKPLFLVVLFCLSPLVLSACSVGMAASGKENPNVAVCREGSTRLEIEHELGAPVRSYQRDNGDLECVYEYEIGDEPSTGRAVGHATLDVLTLGIWEIVGTPIEASKGDKFELVVVYGPDGVAKEVTSRQLE